MEETECWTAYVDGASRGNPGVAGIGIVLMDGSGEVVKEIGEPLGISTNNVAEYSAMVRALEEARGAGCDCIHIYTDSELMAHQINGKYAVKAAHLRPYYLRVIQLRALFQRATVQHIPREKNRRADTLSNIGADQVKTEKHGG
jgi:ribonuclease HI